DVRSILNTETIDFCLHDVFHPELRIIAIIQLRHTLRYEHGQYRLSVFACDTFNAVEYLGDLLNEFLLTKLFGDVIDVNLDFSIGIVLVGSKLSLVVVRFVLNDLSHDCIRRILTCFKHELLKSRYILVELKIDDLRLTRLNIFLFHSVADIRHYQRIGRGMRTDLKPSVKVRGDTNRGAIEEHVDKGKWITRTRIGNFSRYHSLLRERWSGGGKEEAKGSRYEGEKGLYGVVTHRDQFTRYKNS